MNFKKAFNEAILVFSICDLIDINLAVTKGIVSSALWLYQQENLKEKNISGTEEFD